MVDELFRILANRHRRRVLTALLACDSRDDELSIPDDVRIDEDEPEAMLELVHRHLPLLADAGLVRWDREAETVAIGPQFEAIRPTLELLVDNADLLPCEWPVPSSD